MHKAKHRHFVYNQTMDVGQHHDLSVSRIAAAIAEPARVRMLYCLMDGHARTSTELAAVAEVSPSTASVHLARLKQRQLVKVLAQGKYRYYRLAGRSVAMALEALQVAAGGSRSKFVPTTPPHLRGARTCYDHMAGAVAVALHDRILQRGWLKARARDQKAYDLTAAGTRALGALGVQVEETLALRRRFAFACLDWSERRPHVGGALGAALLTLALKKKWVVQDLDSRALSVTRSGKQQMSDHFGVSFQIG
jgi:DNA-binding transcriptional ArsR family regulator